MPNNPVVVMQETNRSKVSFTRNSFGMTEDHVTASCGDNEILLSQIYNGGHASGTTSYVGKRFAATP